jgi:hypothetical protein
LCYLGLFNGVWKKRKEWSKKKKLKVIKEVGFSGFVGRTAFASPDHVQKSGLLFA